MWINHLKKIKQFLLNLFFPKVCFGCHKEGSWLCEDCISTLDIQNWSLCPVCQKRVLDFKTCKSCRPKTNLTALFTPLSYQNPLIKKVIHYFKYEPFIKELVQPLSHIIISHLNLIECPILDKNFILIPVPLYKSRLRWRGYNQSEELARELSNTLQIPIETDLLVKEKSTLPQIELTGEEREKNIKGVFSCQNIEKFKGKKVLLIDDVFTTGATMEECSKVLKEAGARETWGVVVARG